MSLITSVSSEFNNIYLMWSGVVLVKCSRYSLSRNKVKKIMSYWCLNLCMLGNFFMLLLSSADFFKTNFFKKTFQGHYQRDKWFGSRSALAGSKLFTKFISRRQDSLLAEKRLMSLWTS